MALPATTYDTATASNPSSALTDFTLMVDLSRMSSAWWSAVDTSDGTKGRAAKNDGTELAVDWLDFDDSAETGWARVKWTGSLASSGTQIVRIYPPVSGNASVAASGTYGSDNAYNSDMLAYYPDGGGTDRTSNGLDLTGAGGVDFGGATGKVGAATDYDGSGDEASTTASAILNLPATHDFALVFWANPDEVSSTAESIGWDGSDDLYLYVNDDVLGTGGARVFWRDIGGSVISENGTDQTGNWGQYAFVSRAADDHEMYHNTASAGTSSGTGTTGPFSSFGVSPGSPSYNGQMDELMLLSAAPSSAWLSHEYDQTNDNATFWGTWTNVPVASGGNRRRRLILGAAA
jgi:hypothetical protein